jgi:hypothetical protein
MSRAAHATPLTYRHPCSGAALRPPAPRQRVPSLHTRHRSDAELRAGHRRKTAADRLHLGSLIDARRGRGREVRCLAAGDLRLHPPLARSTLARVRPARRGAAPGISCFRVEGSSRGAAPRRPVRGGATAHLGRALGADPTTTTHARSGGFAIRAASGCLTGLRCRRFCSCCTPGSPGRRSRGRHGP